MQLDTPSIDEYDRMLELWDEAGLPYKPEGRDTRENIARELREQPEYWAGAYEDGTLVGLAFGTDDGRKGWINRLAVAKEYRGNGIGTAIVEELERVFEENGFGIWAVLVEPDNPGAMAFFERMGFDDSEIRYLSKRESETV